MCTHFERHPLFERVSLEELVSRGSGGRCKDAGLSQSGSVLFEPISVPGGWDGSLRARGHLKGGQGLIGPFLFPE